MAPNNQMTFQDLIKRRGTMDSDSVSDEEQQHKVTNYYAGGESSGINVAAPASNTPMSYQSVQDIINKAKDNPQSRERTSEPQHCIFMGTSRSLHDSGPSPSHGSDKKAEGGGDDEVKVLLIFWSEGFSILKSDSQDGDLYFTYEEDRNGKRLLDQIRQGIAPLREMRVKPGTPVSLTIDDSHISQSRSAGIELMLRRQLFPSKASVASEERFAGQGQVLSTTSSSASSAETEWPEFPTDHSSSTTRIQLRFADKRKVLVVDRTSRLSDLIKYIKKHAPRHQRILVGVPARELSFTDADTVESIGLFDSILTLH
jgi:hypothetical protein